MCAFNLIKQTSLDALLEKIGKKLFLVIQKDRLAPESNLFESYKNLCENPYD